MSDIPKLLEILEGTKDYPNLKGLHDRAMKDLLKLNDEAQKALDEQTKAEQKAAQSKEAAANVKKDDKHAN